MYHQFEEVSNDYVQLTALDTAVGSKEGAIATILYDLSRVHTDLALHEAVQTAEDIFATWLADKPAEAFDDEDLSLLCFCHMILDLGWRFLSDSAHENRSRTTNPPSWSVLEKLRARFLRERRAGLLAMVHLAESISHPPDVLIIRVRETLGIITEGDHDLRVYLGGLLVGAHFEKDAAPQVVQEVLQLRSLPYSSYNPEVQWWAEYYLLKTQRHEQKELDAVERLLQACSDRGARNAALACRFLEAEIHLNRDDEEKYTRCIRDLLERW